MSGMQSAMARQSPSTVRSAAFRSRALSFEHTFLNWVEIGAVGREVEQMCARRFDQVAHLGPLVAGEIVHDDNVARPQRRGEKLLDVSFEDLGVDRPLIEDVVGRRFLRASVRPRKSSFSNGREGFVMPALACWASAGAVAKGHDEDQLRGISFPAGRSLIMRSALISGSPSAFVTSRDC